MQHDPEVAFRKLATALKEKSRQIATAAAASAVSTAGDNTDDAIDDHSDKRQFVHGVGANYVAKTSHPSQWPHWNDIIGKPAVPGLEDVTIDADQVISGILDILRIPVAAFDESDPTKVVRSDDPRLSAQVVVLEAVEALAAGDYVSITNSGGETKAVRASAATDQRPAIGYVVESTGAGSLAVIYQGGINPFVQLSGLTSADVGRSLYLSATNPGKVSVLPPGTNGQMIQVVAMVLSVSGSVVRAISLSEPFVDVSEVEDAPTDPTNDKHYRHVQITPAATWSVAHSLGKFPSVAVVDSSQRLVLGDVRYVSLNLVEITFSAPFSGEAYCN